MRSKLCIIIGFLCTSLFLFAQEGPHTLFMGEAYEWNDAFEDLYKAEVGILYIPDVSVFYLARDNWLGLEFIKLDRSGMNMLISVLDKYLEWEKIAVENETTITKDIPIGPVRTAVGWEYGDDWYFSSGWDTPSNGPLELEATFFSQNNTNHQLVLSTNKVESLTNKYIDYEMETLYFSKSQVLALKEGISEEAIEDLLLKIKEEEKESDLFN